MKGKTKQRKKRRASVKIRGLAIDIPPELDLPAGAPFEGRDPPATMRIPKDIKELFGPLVDIATNAWRLKTRMVDPDSGKPKEDTRKLYRFVEGLFRALDEAGIQVIDKTSKAYDSGMSEKVINFEQTPGLLKEEIIETIRPSIRWKEQPLYHGDIIVGIPVIETRLEEERKTEPTPAPTEAAANSAETADATDASPGAKPPGRGRNESPGIPESDAMVSDEQADATELDSAPDQLEPVISENWSGEDTGSEVVEGDSASARSTHPQDDSVEPQTSEQTETPEQEEKE